MDDGKAYVEPSPPLVLRPVRSEDSAFLFELANDPFVRANSFTQRPIDPQEHEAWFAGKMNDPRCLLLIARVDGKNVGQLRVDTDNGSGTISFSVCPSARNSGYGTAMLKELIKRSENNLICRTDMQQKPVTILIGQVKKENIASQRAFLKAGFMQYELADMYEYRCVIG